METTKPIGLLALQEQIRQEHARLAEAEPALAEELARCLLREEAEER